MDKMKVFNSMVLYTLKELILWKNDLRWTKIKAWSLCN